MKRLMMAMAVLAAALSGCALTQDGRQAYGGASAPGAGEVSAERPFPRAADRGLF
jgi:hypothetical protein